MKKRISITFMILLLLISLFGTFCYATEIQPRTSVEDNISGDVNAISNTDIGDGTQISDTDETQPNNDIIYDDLYVFENSDYEMDKLIDGNAYIFVNGDVKFSGAVNGSVFIMANGTVEFTDDASIYDALYIMAQEVKVNGSVYDVYGLAQKIELMESGKISRDFRVIANDVKLRGYIYRDVYLTAENIDVKDDAGAAFVGGNFNYTSTKEAEGLNDVVEYGEINFTLEENNDEEVVSVQDKVIEYISSAATSVVYVIVIYFILMLIAPKFVERVGKDIKQKAIIDFVVGLVAWVAIVLAILISFMLVFTSFGSAAAIIAWIAMFTIIYISSAIFSISVLDIIKEKVSKIKDNKGLEICTLVVIALVVWGLQKLPFIGGFVSFIVLTMGIGLILRNIISKKENVVVDQTTVE